MNIGGAGTGLDKVFLDFLSSDEDCEMEDCELADEIPETLVIYNMDEHQNDDDQLDDDCFENRSVLMKLMAEKKQFYDYVELDHIGKKLPSEIMFQYKNTDCRLIISESTAIQRRRKAEGGIAFFSFPSVYFRRNIDSESYPCQCIAIISKNDIAIFDGISDMKKKAEAVNCFCKMSEPQQEYVRRRALRPRKVTEKKSEPFVPVIDKKSLEAMYLIYGHTLSSEVRARVDSLFSRYDYCSPGDTKKDIVTQLSYLLCIDTDRSCCGNRSYEEIIEIMDRHIYGMTLLKERIAEYILAMQFADRNCFAILLIGSPGVGKTSFCNAVAEIYGCEIANVDCSGVDYIGLSGLVSSYSGAQPSKISKALYEKGKTDLILRLDEIDKLANDKVDAFSALAKPLSWQHMFFDEFLADDIDLTNCKIICTANDPDKIPGYILNRFSNNVFVIPDYSTEDKKVIARDYIIPRKLEEYRIGASSIEFSDEALTLLAEDYCSDKGARMMEGYLETLVRKVIRDWSTGVMTCPVRIDADYVKKHIPVECGLARKPIGFTPVA